MSDAAIPYFRIRGLHPVSGAEVWRDLPVLDGSWWEDRGMQPGGQASAALGQFELVLPPPGTDLHRQNKLAIDSIDYKQRLEIYHGEIAGDPAFTGTIRRLPRDLGKYAIQGDDSLILLQQQRTHRTEFLNLSTDKLAKFALKGWTSVHTDDFSGDLSAYTNNASWSIATYPDDGRIKSVTNSVTGAAKYLYTASKANASYLDCHLFCWFRVTMGTDATLAGEAALLAALADTSNYILGRAVARQVTTPSTRWEIDLEIWDVVAGVSTRKSLASIVVVEPSNPLKIQMALIGKRGTLSGGTFTPDVAGADYLWRLTANGVDVNCTYTKSGAGSGTSGSVGLRWNATAGGSPAVYGTKLAMRVRSAFFANGSIPAGSRSIAQLFAKTAHLDILQQSAATEARKYRKNPKAGLNNDVVDMDVIGTDLTAKVKIEEEVNAEAVSIEVGAEGVASDLEMAVSPGSDAAAVEWPNLTTSGVSKYGWLTDIVAAQNIADIGSAVTLAETMLATKAAPGAAKRLTVVRDAGWADTIRPLDSFELTVPRLNVFRQSVVLMSRKVFHGKEKEEWIGDQYPLGLVEFQLRRLMATIEQVQAGVASVTPTGPSGTVYDNRYGVPDVHPFYSGMQLVDATHSCKFPIFIPSNLLAIQKITISFQLLPYRYLVSQNTDGNGLHYHATSIKTNQSHVDDVAVQYSPSANVLENAAAIAAGLIATSADSSSAGGSNITGPPKLVDGTTATGATVKVDGVALLSGPYNTDQTELDITNPNNTFKWGAGLHSVEVTSSGLGAISAQVEIAGLFKST